MDLSRYFENDDGSLPEIEIEFSSAESLQRAFTYLFDLGAENIAANGSYLWLRKELSELPFSGPKDAALVSDGRADSFHVVLASIRIGNHQLPALGVLVDPTSLVIDYRMGPDWSRSEIGALIVLLKSLIALGGTVSVARWWGSDGQDDFSRYLGRGA
ncbi:hypothetical protein IB223_16245 [Pseudoxanthomonas sp. PXM03]|uniref:hypothetical protein n=1 Tax=Pseudoxanthomonas sp. PXM03 TaxID=2769284 RepID=UPI00177C76C4|nr:hypothetical protein [Pseudoxanthomonas sp. PXM03]MBD9437648.1 hypothetical protein [Pseudoxanthomonas sp. PXM03]